MPESVYKRLAASNFFVLKYGHKLCPSSLGRFRYIQLFQLNQIILTSFYLLLFRCGLRCFSGKWSSLRRFPGVCSALLCSLVEGRRKELLTGRVRPAKTGDIQSISSGRTHPMIPKAENQGSPQDWLHSQTIDPPNFAYRERERIRRVSGWPFNHDASISR